MKYFKFVILIISLLLIALALVLFKPFLKTISPTLETNIKIQNYSFYKSENIYCLIVYVNDRIDIYFIDKSKKEIYMPNHAYYSFLGKIILWKRDQVGGVSLTNIAKVGEQDILWLEESVFFTHGQYKEEKIKILW